MVPQRKLLTVDNLAEKIKQAKAMILSDYSGLNVAQISELRRDVKKAGGEFEVVKNTLLRLAAKDISLDLTGPTACLWLYQEDLTPLKALNTFIKKADLPKIKFGFWQGQPITLEKIKELANLPGLEELKAKLVAVLQSPFYGLHSGLNGNIRKLVYILKVKGGEGNGRKKTR